MGDNQMSAQKEATEKKLFSTENVLKTMLTENTGKHMLDSGGHYGRNWEQNQDKDFEDEPVATHDIEEWDGDINVHSTVSTYHYLKHRVEYDKETMELTSQFRERSQSGELENESWLQCMKACFGGNTVNTYNHEFHNTDQILQFATFTLTHVTQVSHRDPRPEDKEFRLDDKVVRAEPDIHGDYVALQIHGGCDVRGGYTAPVIFKASHGADYLMMECTTDVHCPNCGWVGSQYQASRDGDWDEIRYDEDAELLFHEECDSELTVSTAVSV